MIVSLVPVPALLIRMSHPPNSRSTAAISASAPAAPARSQVTPTARTAKRAVTLAAASCTRSAWRAASTRSTPSAASPSATASPMPVLPPVMTATFPLRPRSMESSSFDDGNLAAVDGHRHGQHQHDAEDDLLGEDVDADEGHADPHHRDDQGADHRASDAADAPGDRRAADHDGGDRRQQQLVGKRRRAARQPAGEDDAGEAGEGRREGEGDDLLAVDLDARGEGGGLAGADRGAVAAEAGPRLDDMAEQQDGEPDEDLVRDAERGAGDP